MKEPLVDALKEYVSEGTLPMHMPGHKQGRGFSGEFTDNIVRMDLTEVPGLDNLHYPDGVIKDAEELAAKAFGAEYTFFIVNGSTAGIYAMMIGVLNPGDKVLIMRNSHRSVYNALIIGDLIPCYLKPHYCKEYGIAMGATPKEVGLALDLNSDVKAVVVTSPNYYGFCIDIKGIAEEVHRRGKLLLVDEAHGAHLHFCDRLPSDAISQGADVVVQSAHKTLCAFTQTAYLHVSREGSRKVDIDRLKSVLRLTQSTSPSYMLMASLDYARAIMDENGEALLGNAITLARAAREELRSCGVRTPGSELIGHYGVSGYDDLKLNFSMTHWGYSGYQVEEILRNKYGVQLEMSDPYNALAMITISDDQTTVDRLVFSVNSMAQNITKREPIVISGENVPLPPMCIKPRQAFYKAKKKISLKDACGKISGSFIVPYPPGIPIACPGEVITEELIDYIARYENVQGVKDGMVKVISF